MPIGLYSAVHCDAVVAFLSPISPGVTLATEPNEIQLGIFARMAAKFLMVNLHVRHRAAGLTPPSTRGFLPLPIWNRLRHGERSLSVSRKEAGRRPRTPLAELELRRSRGELRLPILGESYKFVLTDGHSRPTFSPICPVEADATVQRIVEGIHQ